jgi:hypothetical protein
MVVSRAQLTHHLPKRWTAQVFKIRSSVLVGLCAIGMAFAQVFAAASDCASNAVGKDGKPLAGAAKTYGLDLCEVRAE